MKKLLILCLLPFMGCTCKTTRIIQKIVSYEDGKKVNCQYYLENGSLSEVYFTDSCGKYNVGDTLK